jgi:hypothetical protein
MKVAGHLKPPETTNSFLNNSLSEEAKDICIWFYSGGISKVLDKYASQAVQPEDSLAALDFLAEQARSTDNESMQKQIERFALGLIYMHAPEVVLTPRGEVLTPLASHKLYKQ